MATRPDPDIDDDFSELYKEYTGPPGTRVSNSQERPKENKRSLAGSDEEEEPPRDPNAVPTDFTSREAKVWEAKSKATERNWKKRKEEEMICKICGESGHFTQGCPSTLGANRKSQDFIERVPAREKHVKALFTEKVVQRIEKDIGCKLKMEEKFIIVSGKDRLILHKGVDAVRKVIKEEGNQKGTSSSYASRSRSPERSPAAAGARQHRSESQRSHSGPQAQFQPRFGRPEKAVDDQRSHSGPQAQLQPRFGRQEKVVDDQRSHSGPQAQLQPRFGRQEKVVDDQRSHSGPQAQVQARFGRQENVVDDQRSHSVPKSQFQPRFGRQDKAVEDCVRKDLQSLSRNSPQAYGNGGRSRSSLSKSPARPPYSGNSYNSYDGHNSNTGLHRTDGRDTERRSSDMQSGHQTEYPALPQTLEELELQYKREAMDLGRIRDKEEDEENYKHREAIRDIRENYMKKLGTVRGVHVKQWEEFLQRDAQRSQQQAKQQLSAPGFGGYKQHGYSDYDASANPHYAGGGGSLSLDSRNRHENPMDNYTSRSNDTYNDFQRQRREDYGKTYDRY